VDDVRIYNTARNAAAISGDYNKALVGNEANLVAYWKLDTTPVDATLNAYTTPLNIRTLFGVIGSRFYNSSYIHQLGVDHENISLFLTKYDIKYLLSKKILRSDELPNKYHLLTKFPSSPAFKSHMSGQYVYVREEKSINSS